MWQDLSWRRWAFNPCHVSKPSNWLNSKWKRIDRGRKIWPEKIINLEIQKLEGPGEGLRLQPNLFLIFLIRLLSAQDMFCKCWEKNQSLWIAWDTSYYFPDHQGAISQVDFLKGTWASVSCMKIIISVMMNNLTTIPNCHSQTTHGFQQKEIPLLCNITVSLFYGRKQKESQSVPKPSIPKAWVGVIWFFPM